ncbi:MAG: HAMP domain-containing histidine kinase [Clostridia bacterium]|nr:HAMP domain-containing histidine kinase [Clostridia bacterium]
MDKIYIRVVVLSIAIIGVMLTLVYKSYIILYPFIGIIMLEGYLIWHYLKSRKDLNDLIKNLKTFRVTQRTQKLLVQKESEYKELVFEVNYLVEAYEQLKIDKQQQSSNNKQLLSNLSHDIRTPLTSIIGYVDALNDGIITSEEEFEEFIGILSMKSKNLKELTDQIFNVARIDAEDVLINFEYIELNEFLTNILIDFIPQFEKLELKLENEISEEKFMVQADRVALTRIFQNIMKNAIQHGKSGKVIGMKSYIANDFYRVIIWDRGKGIPKSKQQYIFERLYKVDDARKMDSSNSGLGMAIAKKLVLKHNGNIFLKSEENKLTEFFVELPVMKELNI